jgi:hypothetical protein
MYAYIHTCSYVAEWTLTSVVRTHVYMHAYTHTYIHVHMSHVYMHTYIHAHMCRVDPYKLGEEYKAAQHPLTRYKEDIDKFRKVQFECMWVYVCVYARLLDGRKALTSSKR